MAIKSKVKSSQPEEDIQAVLPPFLNLLRAASPITLPRETLCGAITHFLSTLSQPDLTGFTEIIVSSPSLWDKQAGHVDAVRNAVRLGVSGKASSIDQELQDRYFSDIRQRRAAMSWLRRVSKSIIGSPESIGRTQSLVGLLQGLGDIPNLDWGSARVDVEDEAVMSLAPLLKGLENERQEGLKLLCTVIDHISVERLQVLDLEVILAQIKEKLFHTLKSWTETSVSPSPAVEGCASLSRALARTLTVLDHGGPSSRKYAWRAMINYCVRMREMVEELRETEVDSQDTASWNHQKTALFAFLRPSTSMLNCLLHDDPPQDSEQSDMAIEMLLTLAAFSKVVDASEGGLEGYDKLFYGCLDVLAARGDTAEVNNLVRRLSKPPATTTNAKAGFLLTVGEQLVHHLDNDSLRIVLATGQRQIFRPDYKSSFQAAHAFLLTLMQSASRTLDNNPSQGSFLDELLRFYPSLVLKQARDGIISADQLRTAFPLIVQAAARRNASRVSLLVQLFDSWLSTARDPPTIHALRLTRIAITPHIPVSSLPAFFAGLSDHILATEPSSSQRLEMAAAVFKMIVEDLPDEAKRFGMEWWLEWRDVFEGRALYVEGVRAKL